MVVPSPIFQPVNGSPSRIVEKDFMPDIDEPEVIDIIRKIRSRTFSPDTAVIARAISSHDESVSSHEYSAPLRNERPHEDKERAGLEKPTDPTPKMSNRKHLAPGSGKPVPKLKPPSAPRRKLKQADLQKSEGGTRFRSFSPKQKGLPPSAPKKGSTSRKLRKTRTEMYSPDLENSVNVQSFHVEVQTDRKTAHRSACSNPRRSFNAVSRTTTIEDYSCVDYDEASTVSKAQSVPLKPTSANARIPSRSAIMSEDRNSLNPEIFRIQPVDISQPVETRRVRSLSSLLTCGAEPFSAGSKLQQATEKVGSSLESLGSTAKGMIMRLESARNGIQKRSISMDSESSFYREGDTNFGRTEESVITGQDGSTLAGEETMYTFDHTLSTGVSNLQNMTGYSGYTNSQPGCTNVFSNFWSDIRGSYDYDDDTMDGTYNTGFASASLAATSASSVSVIQRTRDPNVHVGRSPSGRVMFA